MDQVKQRHVVVVMGGLVGERIADIRLGRTGTGPEGLEPFLTRGRTSSQLGNIDGLTIIQVCEGSDTFGLDILGEEAKVLLLVEGLDESLHVVLDVRG